MRYLSVCSGIEAASVAWHELGWQPVGFAEIEKFPSQVLAHRFPGVKNYGDMTKYKEWNLEPGSIDLLVGGTPCQAFSVAGLRKGLADPRGNLALTFVAMVDHYRPEWVVWENVPGVLSSNGGRDFGAFLGALGELGYGWAYRILDAQYYGVAQRRRRVFLVGHSSGDPRRCASVLFERESLCGDPAPSRETRQAVASGAGGGTPASGRWPAEVTCTLAACYGQKQGLEDQHVFGGASLFVPAPVCMSSGQVNMAIAKDMAHTLNAANEQQAIAYTDTGIHPEVVNAITASMANSCLGHNKDENVIAIDALNQCLTGDVSKTMAARNDQDTASLVAQPSLYESHPNDSRVTGPVEQCPTVSARWGTGGNNTPLVTDGEASAFTYSGYSNQPAWMTGNRTDCLSASGHSDGAHQGIGIVQTSQASAFSWQCRGDMRGMVPRPTAQLQRCQIEAVMVGPAMHVRRLTPVECERLQGFPDGWTDIRPGGKDTPDSPRYKALGNSMAVPVMRWIGMRIAEASRG